MLSTGILQFMCFAATKYYYLTWVKMAFLVLALVYTFTVRRRVAMADEAHLHPVWSRLAALVSLALWSVVGISGRIIGLP